MAKQIICEYCDSLISPNEDGVCPNCGASIGESLRIQEEERKAELKKKEEERKKELAEQEAKRREQEEEDKMYDIAKMVIGTAISSSGFRAPHPFLALKRWFMKLGKLIELLIIIAGIFLVIFFLTRLGILN